MGDRWIGDEAPAGDDEPEDDVDGGTELLDQWAADDERARLNQGREPGER